MAMTAQRAQSGALRRGQVERFLATDMAASLANMDGLGIRRPRVGDGCRYLQESSFRTVCGGCALTNNYNEVIELFGLRRGK